MSAPRRVPAWLPPAAAALAVAAVAAWSAWHRWAFLDASAYPVGVDGYFYPVQLRALLETGELAYPSSPLAFWLLAPFAAATDPITGTKLGAAILGALIAAPAHLVGRRLGGSRGAGVLAAALATTSAGSFYLTVEFVKNGIGLTVATTYVWLLLRALERPSRGRIAAAAALLVAAVLTHKMAAALAIVVSVPAIAVEARGRGVRGPWGVIASPWRLAAAVAAATAATLAALAALAAWFPQRLPGARDLVLLDHLTGAARWDLPALALGGREIWMGHEAAIGGAAALALLVAIAARWPRRAAPEVAPAARAVAVALAVVAVAIALPWLDVADPQGLGFRLRIAAFLPMALVAAALAGRALAAAPPDVRIATLAAFAAVWAAVQPAARDEGVVRTHPAMAAAVAALGDELPADAVIVCPERKILFMAAWYTRREVRLRPERVPPERRWRLVPLRYVGEGSPLEDALRAARGEPGVVPPRGLHPRHPNGLLVMPEATWAWAVDRLPEPARTAYRKWRTI